MAEIEENKDQRTDRRDQRSKPCDSPRVSCARLVWVREIPLVGGPSWINGCAPGVATLDEDIHGQGSKHMAQVTV